MLEAEFPLPPGDIQCYYSRVFRGFFDRSQQRSSSQEWQRLRRERICGIPVSHRRTGQIEREMPTNQPTSVCLLSILRTPSSVYPSWRVIHAPQALSTSISRNLACSTSCEDPEPEPAPIKVRASRKGGSRRLTQMPSPHPALPAPVSSRRHYLSLGAIDVNGNHPPSHDLRSTWNDSMHCGLPLSVLLLPKST